MNVTMVWQVEQHHASHYVTNRADFRSYSDSCSGRGYWRGCVFDVGALVIAVLCYYRARAPPTNDGRIIYIPRSGSASPLSTRCYN